MRRSKYFPCLLMTSAAALALALPAVLPGAAHATSAARAAHPAAITTMRANAAMLPARAAMPVAPGAYAAPAGPLAVPSDMPASLRVPAGNVAFLAAPATGVQIYTCAMSGTTFAWSAAVPAAVLYNDEGDKIGTHFAGPTWQASDGSTVKGHKLVAITVAPDAIPWLLLNAVATTVGPSGGDTLSKTTYIQRLLTRGGVTPPASACNAGAVGTTQSIPYSALYVFYHAVTFVVSASVAAVGQTITVTGTDFQAGEPVQISWDVTGTTPLASGMADATGTFGASIHVPFSLGVHTILGIGQNSGVADFAYIVVFP